MGHRPLWPRRNRGVLVSPGKASKLLTDHLITGLSLPRKSGLVKPSIHNALLAKLGGYIYEAHFACHDIVMLGKSPIKWRQRPDMTIAVDWDVNHEFNQNKQRILLSKPRVGEPTSGLSRLWLLLKKNR